MDTDTTMRFKGLLEQELEKLQSELATVGRINPENPSDWEPVPSDMDDRSTDLNDFADSIEAYETNAAVLKQLETQLNAVKDALVRIEERTYGLCVVCGNAIELGRLEANAAATTCVAHMHEQI